MTEPRLTRLLPLACLAAALLLFASESMTMFEFTPPGGEALDSQTAGARHGNAMYVIAVFAIGALAVAVLAASKPAAFAVAAMGIVALLIFLLVDLPDAGQVGTLDDARDSFFDAETVPVAGFWLEMVGAIALALSGVALATLTPEQLAELRPGASQKSSREREPAGRVPKGFSSVASPRESARRESAGPRPSNGDEDEAAGYQR